MTETKMITKRRFKTVRSKFGDRIDASVEEKIEDADDGDRLRLTLEAQSPLHITDVDVISSVDDVPIFQ